MTAESLKLALWVSLAVLAYVYFGYPLLLALLTRSRRPVAPLEPDQLPPVTLLISAYNERAVIEEKIQNSLSLSYPKELLRILVISDCSDDGTDDIVLRYAAQGVRLVRTPQRLGKSAGLNLGVSQSSAGLLVFSDANAIYQPDALRLLVPHFSDPAVGYVVGNARYRMSASQTASAKSEGLYWRFETWLKEKESDFGSVVGGDGAIYAIRRDLFTALRPTDINDFLNPLQIVAKGFRGVYNPSAICFEEAGDTFEKEFRRKVRIVSRSFNAVLRAPRVLFPWTQPRHWVALISHKLLRWFAPLFLLTALVANLALWPNPFYRILACLQLACYLLAAIGWLLQSRRALPRLLYLPYYFCLVNLASLLGICKCFAGSLTPTWQTIRQETSGRADSSASLVKRGP